MLSQLKLLGIYQRELSKNHGCAGAALEAVAEAAVKDERENRNRPMALREFAELVQKLVIIGPLTSEQGRQLMMLQEMASTTLEAAVKDAVSEDKPFGWYFMDDPKVFTLPGVGFLVGAEPPTDSIDRIPLYARPQASQLNLDYLREMGRLEARIRELEQASAAVPDAVMAERHRIYAALEADPGALWRDQGFQEWRRNRGADSAK